MIYAEAEAKKAEMSTEIFGKVYDFGEIKGGRGDEWDSYFAAKRVYGIFAAKESVRTECFQAKEEHRKGSVRFLKKAEQKLSG